MVKRVFSVSTRVVCLLRDAGHPGRPIRLKSSFRQLKRFLREDLSVRIAWKVSGDRAPPISSWPSSGVREHWRHWRRLDYLPRRAWRKSEQRGDRRRWRRPARAREVPPEFGLMGSAPPDRGLLFWRPTD